MTKIYGTRILRLYIWLWSVPTYDSTLFMLTAWQGNVFRINGHFRGKPVTVGLPTRRASDVELWYSRWCMPEKKTRLNKQSSNRWLEMYVVMLKLHHCNVAMRIFAGRRITRLVSRINVPDQHFNSCFHFIPWLSYVNIRCDFPGHYIPLMRWKSIITGADGMHWEVTRQDFMHTLLWNNTAEYYTHRYETTAEYYHPKGRLSVSGLEEKHICIFYW